MISNIISDIILIFWSGCLTHHRDRLSFLESQPSKFTDILRVIACPATAQNPAPLPTTAAAGGGGGGGGGGETRTRKEINHRATKTKKKCA
jgi:hypothetical protein